MASATYNGWTRAQYMSDYAEQYPNEEQFSATEWNRWMTMACEADIRRRMLDLKSLIEEMESFSVESELWSGREAKRPRLTWA